MHRVVMPPDTEKIKSIQTLVSTLVGLNAERGDQLTVEAMPFDSTMNMELPSAPGPDSQKHDLTAIEMLKQKPVVLVWRCGWRGSADRDRGLRAHPREEKTAP